MVEHGLTYEELLDVVEEQRTQIEVLRAEIEMLLALVADLEARLGRDSSNSSQPPSADGLAKAPANPRRRGARRPGKQPGDQGRHLARVENPDRVVDHLPGRCSGCDGDLVDAETVGVERRQVFDLPVVRVEVWEHRVHKLRCGCGEVTTGEFPAAVTAPAVYGPRVRATVGYLTVFQHVPAKRCAEAMADLFGVKLATGTVMNIGADAAGRLEDFEETTRDLLAGSNVVHVDETGARAEGRGRWVHVVGNDAATVYVAHERRGHEGTDSLGVLDRFGGIAVHDAWAPYDRYQMQHQLCCAHLLRELDAAADGENQDWAADLAGLLRNTNRLVKQAKNTGATGLEASVLHGIYTLWGRHVATGHRANAPPASGRPQTKLEKKRAALARRCSTRRDDYLRFAVDFASPFDNNLAERDIRMVKLQQKISGCWRTLTGANHWLRVRGYLSTGRKHDQNPYTLLHQLFTDGAWTPPDPAPT